MTLEPERGRAVAERFHDLSTPIRLDLAAAHLRARDWVPEAQIEKIGQLGGEIPVVIPRGGSAFIIRLTAPTANARTARGVYVALDRDLDADELRAALATTQSDGSAAQAHIVGCAVFP